MKREYEHDEIDGESVPPLVITSDQKLHGIHRGTVHVESGTLEIIGTLQGTLDVQAKTRVVIMGKQQGTVAIASGAAVDVHGSIDGTVSLWPGATLVVEGSGRVAGTLSNNGDVVVRGVFGGAQGGSGHLRLEGSGYIKEPVVRDGVHYYEW